MDKYDAAIEHLRKNPEEIETAWNYPFHTAGGCLFMKAGDDHFGPETIVGCLTQIRAYDNYISESSALTQLIKIDERIPTDPLTITVDDLPVFAEWQRRLDKELLSRQPKM